MEILAIDLGKFNSVCCFYAANTRKKKFLTTPTKREYLQSIFQDCNADLVVMESSQGKDIPECVNTDQS